MFGVRFMNLLTLLGSPIFSLFAIQVFGAVAVGSLVRVLSLCE